MKEIVAARINGSIITNKLTDIVEASKKDKLHELYDRERMELMAAFDLGPQWQALASGPTLFIIGDDGLLSWPATLKEAKECEK